MDAKLWNLAELAMQLGLKCPTEKTVVAIVSVPLSCRAAHVTPDDIVHTRTFKSCLKSLWSRGSSGDEVGPTDYSVGAEGFRASFPKLYDRAYSEHPPVRSRLDSNTMHLVAARLPCRSTRSGVSAAANTLDVAVSVTE